MIKSFSLMVAASLSAVASANEIAVSDVTLTQSDSRLVTVSYKLGSKPAIVTVDFLTNGVSIGEEMKHLIFFSPKSINSGLSSLHLSNLISHLA